MSPHICFVGLQNLPMLAPEYGRLYAGGAELQQTLLARALARRGYPVSMVVADLGQRDGAAWDGVRTFRAYRPREGIRFLRFAHPRWTRVWAAMKRADADIYYVSCAGHLLGQVAMFARRYARKLVFRIASNSDCNPRELLVATRFEKALYRYGLKRADLVLAQTAAQASALREHFARPSLVVPPLADVSARRRPFPERDIDALWVGNLRRLKRPELLLEAARRLPHLSFHMIGGPMRGAESYFEEVHAAASALPNVTFHAKVPYHEVRAFYERSKMLVGTSEVEGFPNTYLQSWAHGAPVVAFLDPDELIGQHGLGRQVADSDALCAAIETLSGVESEWNAASGRCTRFVDERFSEERMIAPYLEALNGG